MQDEIGILQKEVSAILLRDWDPLGVADIAELRTEYEGYAAEIVSMYVNKSISAEILFNYLKITTEKSMDMKADDISIAQTVKNLLELFRV